MCQEDEQGTQVSDTEISALVGWMATSGDGIHDTDIVEYCSRLGAQNYNFVNYPIGGMRRSSWRPEKDGVPPPIDLPDLQLDVKLWGTYVIGRISDWIDCDANESWLADLSCVEIEKYYLEADSAIKIIHVLNIAELLALMFTVVVHSIHSIICLKELNYMTYMPLRVLTLELRHRDSPKLAEILTKWMWTRNMTYSIWVFLSTDENHLPVADCGQDTRDIWGIWADFRSLCTNYPMQKLAVGLRLCPNLADEFLEPRLYKRWHAEPLCSFCIETSIFTSNGQYGKCTLPLAHHRLLMDLFVSVVQRPLIHCNSSEQIDEHLRLQYVNIIKQLIREKVIRSKEAALLGSDDNVLFEYLGHREYIDTLQMPLQPLADNLDSGTYAIFEEDSVKYDLYREAISHAIEDLMQMIIEAEELFNAKSCNRLDLLKLELYSIEKNAHAIVTLQFRNKYHWKDRVQIIEGDMRKLSEKVKAGQLSSPDLIVSELLGSFGDNELSPECLDSITDILRPTTISIPQQYTSYVGKILFAWPEVLIIGFIKLPALFFSTHPVSSLTSKSFVLFWGTKYFERGFPGRGRLEPVKLQDGTYALPECPEASQFDEIYVVCMRSVCELARPKVVFNFEHPNFEKNQMFETRTFSSQSICSRRAARLYVLISRCCFEVRLLLMLGTHHQRLMGFAGYFVAQLYRNCQLSIVPQTHTKGLVSWFSALIPLRHLYRLQKGTEVIFHIERKIDTRGVWYEWFCEFKDIDGKVKTTPLQNKDGLSYFMRL
ncbi:Protein arginine N-methyltransferase [Dirofilaria immitis]|nr:Protein arginine N-methyltransferase [Dirofilaria immitis]